MAAIGNAAKHRCLVRQGDALERLASVRIIAFDKTGTLTRGTPRVIAAESVTEQYSGEEIYRLAASAEQLSEHPLGKAIVSCRKEKDGAGFSPAEQFRMIPGRGVTAIVEGKTILAGSERLFSEYGIALHESGEIESYRKRGCTLIYIALDGRHVLRDAAKP